MPEEKPDVDDMWTEDDQKQFDILQKNQCMNHEKLEKLRERLDELNDKYEDQKARTLRSLQADDSQDTIDALACYKRRLLDDQQKSLDVLRGKTYDAAPATIAMAKRIQQG